MDWKQNRKLIFPLSLEQIEDIELCENIIRNHIIQSIQEFIETEDKKLEDEIMNGTGEDEPLGIIRMSDIEEA